LNNKFCKSDFSKPERTIIIMQLFLCKVLKNSKIGYYRLCIFIFSLVVNPAICNAQNSPVYFHHYNVNSGMAHYNVEYIHVQDDGNIWIATANGLQRFDGYTFTNYNYNPDDSLSISDNFITTLDEDPDGNILIGTFASGLNVFDPGLDLPLGVGCELHPMHTMQNSFSRSRILSIRGAVGDLN